MYSLCYVRSEPIKRIFNDKSRTEWHQLVSIEKKRVKKIYDRLLLFPMNAF